MQEASGQWRMPARLRVLAKLLTAFFTVCALSTVAAWGVLLTTLCSSPRIRTPETRHVIPYNCHGMTVFLSPLQDAMMMWLIALFIVFGLLALAAAALLLVAHGRIRIDVRVQDGSATD